MGTSTSLRISHTHTDPTPPCTASNLHHPSLSRRLPDSYHLASSVCLPVCLSVCLSCCMSVCPSVRLQSCCLCTGGFSYWFLQATISIYNSIDSEVIYRKPRSNVGRVSLITSICHATSSRRDVRLSSTHWVISIYQQGTIRSSFLKQNCM